MTPLPEAELDKLADDETIYLAESIAFKRGYRFAEQAAIQAETLRFEQNLTALRRERKAAK